jgi:uncharacterized membrane protein YjgN (DUF898 family)
MGNYQIVYNSIMLAMDKREVEDAFARLFKLSPEKAAAILAKPQTVLRRDLDGETAEVYREKLMAIGLDVDVRDMSMKPPAATIAMPSLASGMDMQKPVLELAPLSGDDQPSAVGYHGNRMLDIDFQANGFDYFRIWIVNIFLTVLTLGIYSAWAKVRTQQYFYSNTRVADAPFQYLAKPLQILQGRIIGVALLGLYMGSQELSGLPAAVSLLVLLLLLPALLVLALSGRFRFTAWRNTGFDFVRDFAGAYKIALLPVVLLGVFATAGAQFAGISSESALPVWGLVGGILLLGFPYWQYSLNHFLVSRATFGGEHFDFPARAGNYYWLYFFKVPALVLLWLLPVGVAGVVTMGHGIVEQLPALTTLWRAGHNGVSITPDRAALGALLLLPPIGAAWIAVFIRASLFNLRYNGMALGKSTLSCRVRAWPLLWIYLSNAVAIVLSIGLFIPWAKVRTVRYRLSCLVLHASYELDDIVGKARRGNAVGAETAALFDVDIAL